MRNRTLVGIARLLVLPALACLLLFVRFAEPGAAQNLPQNLTPDQLQQLLGQQGGGDANGMPRGTAVRPQDNVIQPAAGAPPNTAPPSRLEQIMSRRSGVVLRQFGYDQLGVPRPVSLPQVGAAQDDYLLGPGDEIVVSLRGQENSDFRLTIDRDGRALLPKLAPIPASGRTIGELRADVQAAVHRAYVATDAFITVGHLRQISVFVSGEVNNPGVRIVSGLASAMDVILLSGGIKKTGSLRNIHVVRNGRNITVDLYSLILQRGETHEGRLADGDRVIVPTLGPTAAIAGWVRRPGIYELAPGTGSISAANLIAAAGGLEVRGAYRISMLSVLADGRQQLAPVTPRNTIVRDGDVLYAEPGASQTVDSVTLSGGSALAGRYSLARAGRLSDLLKAPGALGEQPDTAFGVIVRRDQSTYTQSLVAFTPLAVLQGRENIDLRSDDLVRVFSLKEGRLLARELEIFVAERDRSEEALRNPLAQRPNTEPPQGAFANNGNNNTNNGNVGQQQGVPTGTSFGNTAFGAPSPDSTAYGLPSQFGATPDNTVATAPAAQGGVQNGGNINNGQVAPYTTGGVAEAVANSSNALRLRDPRLVLPQEAAPESGTFEDLSVPQGQIPSNQEVRTFAELASQLGVDPTVLVNFLEDHQVTLSGAVRGPGTIIVGPDLTLQDLLAVAGGTSGRVDLSAVELTTTTLDSNAGSAHTQRQSLPMNGDMLSRYIVQPGDRFRFNEVDTTIVAGDVFVQGQVRFPGTYQMLRGERLSELLTRAGGLTEVAYPYGAVFLRKSAAALEREGYIRASKEVENQLLVGLARPNVNEQVSPEAFTAMQGFVTKLENQQALGRISVVADPAVLATKPELDPLLEPGDVIYIPQRPNTVTVLGEVMAQGSFTYNSSATARDYIERAGGYGSVADKSRTFIILPDGAARTLDSSWLSFNNAGIPPGSVVVVPRDISPLDFKEVVVDITQILSQLAVTAASLSVISRN
ncbi:MAG TPA: SLBB domain-containing protein [Rhizomicrobium sp.]|jgi:polysaccharide export outer membrane protein|nr:SLBB domain-containing protein [Rhizomicrobium sp.]